MVMVEQRTAWLWHNSELHRYGRTVNCMVKAKQKCMAISEEWTAWLCQNRELHGYGTTKNCMAMAQQETAWVW